MPFQCDEILQSKNYILIIVWSPGQGNAWPYLLIMAFDSQRSWSAMIPLLMTFHDCSCSIIAWWFPFCLGCNHTHVIYVIYLETLSSFFAMWRTFYLVPSSQYWSTSTYFITWLCYREWIIHQYEPFLWCTHYYTLLTGSITQYS